MTTPSPASNPHGKYKDVHCRPCTSRAELDQCVNIQQQVWKFSERDTVPSDIFIVALNTGGQVMGAFDGGHQVGFTLAFLATHDREIYLHSHFAAVLPAFQGGGIGRLLKLAQREDALQRGIRLIEWTFDPLALMNAHFNLNRLGAIVRRYIPNFYGVTSSPLHGKIPTDRLVAEWWLDSNRVKARIGGQENSAEGKTLAVSLPRNVTELLRSGSPEAGEIQSRIRQQFLDRFSSGYSAVAVEFRGSQASYLLTENA